MFREKTLAKEKEDILQPQAAVIPESDTKAEEEEEDAQAQIEEAPA